MNRQLLIKKLHDYLISQGLPVEFIGIINGNSTPPLLNFGGPLDESQTAAAQMIAASFDWSEDAHAQYLAGRIPKLANLYTDAQAAIANIDQYLMIADVATAAQVRSEVKAIDQRQRRIIIILLNAIEIVLKDRMI